jgi:hypothetical protein
LDELRSLGQDQRNGDPKARALGDISGAGRAYF